MKNVLTHCRYETKYIIESELAKKLQHTLAPYFYYDRYTNEHNGFRSYTVRTLYFDSHDFLWYREKISGQGVRKKIRIRTYEPGVGHKIFFELRERNERLVSKLRIPITNKQIYDVIEGRFQSTFLRYFPNSIPDVIDSFYLGIRPILIVEYNRIAYFSKYTRAFRMTFDYDTRVMLANEMFPPPIAFKRMMPNNVVVLELKFVESIPSYITTVMKKFYLRPVTFSKYCQGVEQYSIVPQ